MNWSGSPPGPDHLQASLFTKQQVQTLDHLLLLSSSDVKSILSDLPLVVAVELKAILKAKEEVRKAEDAVHQAEESLHFARNKLEQLLGGLSVSSTPSPLSKGRFASGALNSSRASLAASPSTHEEDEDEGLSEETDGSDSKYLVEAVHPMHQALSSPDTAKSSIFGISDDERKELLAIWEEKLALQVKVRSDNTVVGRFYEEFWKVWPIKEPMACIFAAAPLVDKSKPISNIIIYMMNALKNPVITVEHLMKLSMLHLALGLDIEAFRRYAVTISQAAALSVELPPKLQEAMMIIVLKFGEIIVSGYDAVRKGSLRRVSLKSGRVWRRLVLHSNHDCLSFYKDVKMEKPFPKMKRLAIANIEDADSADADEEQEFVLKLKLKDDPDKPCFLGFATKADRDKLHGELKTIQKGLRYARELDQCRLK